MNRYITCVTGLDPETRPVEIVERKGVGHPDTICDALAEEFSRALCRYYLDHFGAVLHHNVDKALMFGGAAQPVFGGGQVLSPIEIYLAGRATEEFQGHQVPVRDLAFRACTNWLRENFHALDPERHVKLCCLTRPGSADLVEMFLRQRKTGVWLANDTSCGVGFAPKTGLEHVVLAVEKHLNSANVKRLNPEIGEDIKVLGVRDHRRITLTLSIAAVDHYLRNAREYVDAKVRWEHLARQIAQRHTGDEVTVHVNMADDAAAGAYFLTVTGTSAESGDDGEVGRGNRVNGLITPGRPMTIEAAAGKNPTSHVGKLYNIAAQRIAESVVRELPQISAAECFLVSQIGKPICDPQLAEVRVQLREDASSEGATQRAQDIISHELSQMENLSQSLHDSRVSVF